MNDFDVSSPFLGGDCQSCHMITHGWNPWTHSDQPCPRCGEVSYGLPWPPLPAAGLVRKAFDKKIEDGEDLAVAETLVAISLEAIVEWTLMGVLERFTGSFTLSGRLADYLMESDLNVERRLGMLKEITEIDYKKVAKARGYPEFPTRWKQLRERRNRFVHKADYDEYRAERELELIDLFYAASQVFADVSNLTWVRLYPPFKDPWDEH